MKNKTRTFFMISCILFFLFIVLIVLLKTVDVGAIGPEGSEVGFSSINKSFHDLTGVKEFWYDITDIYGYFSIFIALCFCVFGFIQLIIKKSIKKVDRPIILLGFLYLLTALFYVLFEIVIINYRPIILDEGLEASFPSSHTMFVIVIMGSVCPVLCEYIKNKFARYAFFGVCSMIALVTVIGRLISGVHWLTDIIGGVLLGSALLFLFFAFLGRNPSENSVKTSE